MLPFLELLILQQNSIQPGCAWITDFDNEERQKLLSSTFSWAESAKKSRRWHRGYLWLVNARHCHFNAVGRLWWSSKRDYIRAEFTLRLQETQRSLRITKRHPRNQRWKSGPISAATLQDKYVKRTRLQDLHLRKRMHLQSSALKRVMIFAVMSKNCRDPHKQLQRQGVTFPSAITTEKHLKAWIMLTFSVSVSSIWDYWCPTYSSRQWSRSFFTLTALCSQVTHTNFLLSQ